MTDDEARMIEKQRETREDATERLRELVEETHVPYPVLRALFEAEIARYQLERLYEDEREGLYSNPTGEKHAAKLRADASDRLERYSAEAVRLDDEIRARFLARHDRA